MLRRALLLLALLALGPAPAAFAAALDALPGAGDLDIPLPAAPAFDRAGTMICVDPGHPNSFNPATDTVNGTTENRINWQVGVRLQRVLKERGYEVVMTRNAELNYVENKDRARLCNIGSALVVHLHCESTPGTGFALYYPDRQGVHDYKDDPENGFRGPEQAVITASKPLAEVLAAAMEKGLAGDLRRQGVYGDSRTAVGSRQGALTYSIFSRIPTVTIEMAVLTNKKDAAFIKSEAGQEKMAGSIAEGISRYLAP
jgi:N-acetylmuramoyl-L-alanine amidase